MHSFRATLFATGLILATTCSAFAMPITAGSSISIDGGVAGMGSASLDLATGLDFLTIGKQGPQDGTLKLSADATGSMSAFTAAGCTDTCGTIRDIASFSPFTSLAGFFKITEGSNTISFDLKSLTDITRTSGTASHLAQISVSGTGVFHFAGYDPTPGLFTLTAQGGQVTTFSGTTVAGTPVPEPASMALLGAGLVGLGMVRRRKAA